MQGYVIHNPLLYTVQMHSMVKACTLTNVLISCIIDCTVLFLHALVWGEKSYFTTPFLPRFSLVFLWFNIFMPLGTMGNYFGNKKFTFQDLVTTNRFLACVWYLQLIFLVLIRASHKGLISKLCSIVLDSLLIDPKYLSFLVEAIHCNLAPPR